MSSKGVFPDHMLAQIIEAWSWGIPKNNINPASVDLPLSGEMYRLESIFMPRRGETIRDILEAPGVNPSPVSFDQPLAVGVNYIIRVDGNITLPKTVYGYINPKSSTGRNNLFSRVVADGVSHYDALTPEGWSGEAWILARPDSYPVRLSRGERLSQVRLFDGYARLSRSEVELEFANNRLLYDRNRAIPFGEAEVESNGSVFLTLNFDRPGWVCHNATSVVDFGKIKGHRRGDWYAPVEVRNGALYLKKDHFYILCTHEFVRVPPHLSAELRPIDPRFGEFRAHAAGYIDPGWGWGVSGRKRGQRITLEVIPREDLVIRPRQVIAKLRYERMKSPPKRHYHDLASSNYRKTASVSLSKHFK